MVKISVRYEGQLHCQAVHGPSGTKLATDAPVDNEGRGESFSPTDLVATALAACMATIMGIAAKRHSITLEGMTIETSKEMSTDTPRRIVSLKSKVTIPLPGSHPQRKLLEAAALGCPVHHSLDPKIAKPVEFVWEG
ncbi:MAG: OsmC family peroxiredoxin [Proteobacteria bacterium]|nr:OsmC family peroxiredoxin [Pseudomonadota bacterium]NBS50267.1 OsmC family peroxiredoxin [Verrucomicrobiota bacterium]